MPERSFGRTIRYRRTKLGLSQAKLGDLVGRSASTIRSWERDQAAPNDPSVLTILAAVLGLEERILYDKAGVAMPVRETSPTVEEAFASLAPESVVAEEPSTAEPVPTEEPALEEEPEPQVEPDTEPEEPEPVEPALDAESQESVPPFEEEDTSSTSPPVPPPAYISPTEGYVITAPTPSVVEPSYMEDSSQRQMYRVRNLATLVLLVALVVVLLWALSNTVSAFGDWWDDFFGQLRF